MDDHAVYFLLGMVIFRPRKSVTTRVEVSARHPEFPEMIRKKRTKQRIAGENSNHPSLKTRELEG